MNPETIRELEKPLDRRHVTQRTQSGRSLSYVEGWHVIAEANRIFGFDGWHRETVEMREVRTPELVKSGNGKETWRVGFIAKVRVTVGAVVREGTGFGAGALPDLGEAYESAIKEAETDAMKRAFMTFGNPFGLALYDKTQANVVNEPRTTDQRSEQGRREVANANAGERVSKADARPIYSKLVEDMRRMKSKDDLRRWIADPEVKELRAQLPADWDAKLRQEAAEYGNGLPNQYAELTMAG